MIEAESIVLCSPCFAHSLANGAKSLPGLSGSIVQMASFRRDGRVRDEFAEFLIDP